MKMILTLIIAMLSQTVFSMDYGIDRLDEASVSKIFEGKKLAVLTHAAAKSKNGIHLIDFLHQKFELKKIFAPEHGLRTLNDDWVDDGIDEATGLPVISLYKRGERAPKPSDLVGIDAVVIDLQDVGVRYYTYFSTIAEVMKALSPLNIEVIILDRPNLLGGAVMEGKVLDPELAGSFTAYHTVPTRHGMSLGELALMVNSENNINSKLTVIAASGWNRENLIFSSERPWLAPSPALVKIDQVGLYAIWGTLENFNLSVGRGKSNDMAFRVIGAPWITQAESALLAKNINTLGFLGLEFSAHSWKVDRAIYEDQEAHGVLVKWNGSEVRTDEFTYKVSALMFKLFKGRAKLNKMSPQSYGSVKMIEAIEANLSWESYQKVIDRELKVFEARRAPFLLY
jgi:uncharacterized protein YbbC (DUF1343 family)